MLARAGGDAVSGSGLDIRGLLALGPLGHLERHLLAFLEGLEPAHLDGREMREQILAAVVGRDEPVALGSIEPLHRTGCHTPTSNENEMKHAGIAPARCLSFKIAYGRNRYSEHA